jgi:hypothetical protein
MNDLLDGNSSRKITLAEIEHGIREGQRLRSEEIHRLGTCFNALIRKAFIHLGRLLRHAGSVLITTVEHRMEAMALRLQRTRAHYD